MILEQFAETTLSITDDSGFLALVNTERYNSFIDGNWSLEQIQQRFTKQTKEKNLFIWSTGSEGFYNVAILPKPTSKIAFKELNGEIQVTNGRLYLTNFEDLSMAAQFQDKKLPAVHNANLTIQLTNAIYNIIVRQMFNPNVEQEENDDVAFEIILTAKTSWDAA